MSNRALINALGQSLQALRLPDETQLLVSIAANGPSADTPGGHMTVTIRSGADTATSDAVALDDAICLARGKLRAAAKKREDEKAEAKGEVA